MMEKANTSPQLLPKDIKTIQCIISTCLYYTQAIGSTMLVALSTLAAEQAQATEIPAHTIINFLNYLLQTPTPIYATHQVT